MHMVKGNISVIRKNEVAGLGDRNCRGSEILCLDRTRREVYVGSNRIALTTTEFKLLSLLMERRGYTYGRDQLLREVWGYAGWVHTRTVDTHIARLREKLEEAAPSIETVRGIGYRFNSLL